MAEQVSHDNESKAEQVERVRQMATEGSGGDGVTWDLSENDCRALSAVLSDRDDLLAALKRAVETIHDWHEIPSVLSDDDKATGVAHLQQPRA